MSEGIYRQRLPRRLVNSSRIQKVCFGDGFGIGLTKTGQLLAWGKDYPGKTSPALQGKDLRTPTLIETDFEVADIASGHHHCGLIDSEGRVHLWGDNGNRMGGGGQLGNDSYTAVGSPTLVKSLVEENVKVSAVSCGEQHTLFLADDEGGSVYGCGMAEYGRLGIIENWTTDVLVPQKINPEAFGGERVIQVSAGFIHSMALTESGKIFSWGRNDHGQLGLGDSFIDMHSMEIAPRLVDSEELADKKVVKIKAGRGLSGALTSTGELYHWGHKILHQPIRVMHEYPEDQIVDFTISGSGSNMCTAFITKSGELYTVGPDSSTILGRELPSSRVGSLFSSIKNVFRGKDNKDGEKDEEAKVNKVVAFDGRVVHKVFGGFGEQMAAMVSAPINSD